MNSGTKTTGRNILMTSVEEVIGVIAITNTRRKVIVIVTSVTSDFRQTRNEANEVHLHTLRNIVETVKNRVLIDIRKRTRITRKSLRRGERRKRSKKKRKRKTVTKRRKRRKRKRKPTSKKKPLLRQPQPQRLSLQFQSF